MNEIIHKNSYLTLHYRILLNSGEGKGQVFIETFNGNPATLAMGTGQWLDTLEAPLIGHSEGDAFSYEIEAKDAYGLKNPELLQYVTKEMLSLNAGQYAEFNQNDLVEFTAPNGAKYSGYFKKWENENALFDFNHPLAGIDLKVEVEILGVM